MGWIFYVLAWLAAALFWTLAAASGAGQSPLQTLPFGLLAMGSAAVMGVGLWRLTGRVAWDWRSRRFYVSHLLGLAVFTTVYATSWMWPDLVAGRAALALDALRSSPVQYWNLLMGTWLYLIVAGLSYAVRAERRLRAQEAAAAEARLLAQQAQLAALRAQINPHFLFNALHSVGALVTTDPEKADRALERLGDLLRYVLGAADRVPFGQEWRFTSDYLAFEALRLGERLRIDHHVQDEAHAVVVPPLLLQPLVENAVRHGIADRPEGGRIEVRASVVDGRLHLRVSDDGPAREEGVGRGTRAAGTGGNGLGLASVRRRLAALYGTDATLDVSRDTHGYSVSLDLPTRLASDEGSAA